MKISSVNNQLIKDTVKLHKKKYRDDQSLFLIEGYHLFEEAKKFGVVKTVFTTDGSIQGSEVIHVTEPMLEKLAQTKTPQGVLCVCNKLVNKTMTEKVLILEQIQDPGNLGTLLRSALGFGFKTVILDNTVDLYNDKVIRSTQGNIFRLNIIEMNTIDFIKSNPQYIVYGTSMDGVALSEIEDNEYIALVLGNEGSGVSKRVLRETYKNVSIKTSIESLNVGVAGSIIMHHIKGI